MHPRRPKIAARRAQDRLGSVFFRLDFSLRFLIVLGSILVPFWPPKWSPRGTPILGESGLGSVLFRLVLRDRFFGRLGLLLGSFWVVLGSS